MICVFRSRVFVLLREMFGFTEEMYRVPHTAEAVVFYLYQGKNQEQYNKNE